MTRQNVDPKTGRKFYLDHPNDIAYNDELTFILNIHGGGSAGVWQRGYFPAHDYANEYRLVVAAPTAATDEPIRHWVAEADDEHLRSIVEFIFERFGVERIRSFWLAGHSQGGLTCNRLLGTDYFADRVDGWLSLSGGRIGRAPVVEDFGPPRPPGSPARFPTRDGRPLRLGWADMPDADFSHIFCTGEHEITSLADTSPWAEKYGSEARVHLQDVIDVDPGQVWDNRWESFKPSWGREARPGTAKVYVYPGARDGRVIADVIRLDKGHTEGLEPKITQEVVKLIVCAAGGKARDLADHTRSG